MKVLLAASEVAPIIKLGGLGDVVGSLPKALEKLDINVDVIVPFFPIAKTAGLKVYQSLTLEVPFANAEHEVLVHKTKLPGSNVDVFLLQNAEYFSVGGKNAFANSIAETEMFTFFNRAVVEFIKSKFNTYDLVHCNDWHTGLITHILHEEIGDTRPATLLTIHNLSYQGISGLHLLQELGMYPGEDKLIDWDIEDGDINLMQQGLSSSDYISTVSPTYAKEILSSRIGGKMSEILENREARITGIINGIDYSQFPRDFDLKTWKEVKAKHKKDLRKELNLKESSKPLFALISRLDPNQKGLDVLYKSIPDILKSGQLVLLGTGDPLWEGKLKKLKDKKEFSGNLSVNILFDVDLAMRIYKSSDFFLMPSKFEPCGLAQMISMWYGSLPIVHETGGLKDTVIEGETGFVYKSQKSAELSKAIDRALMTYENPKEYDNMVENALNSDFSWEKSAMKYKELYKKVIDLRHKALDLASDGDMLTNIGEYDG